MKAGNVPTERIGPILARLIAERWPNGGGCEVLAQKIDCDESAIRIAIEQRHEGITFDFADKLLCALGPGIRLWRAPELADIYYGTKFLETCAAPGCNKTFPEYHRGGKPKRTCSPKYKARVEAVQLGRVGAGAGMRVLGRCNKGHKLTPENTKISKGSGFRRCRTCARERDRMAARERRALPKAAA